MKGGKCNFDDLKKFRDNLKKLDKAQTELFLESCAKELAARLLAKTVKRTPTGEYPVHSGKKGGTLKRGWTIGEIEHTGGIYKIDIINPTEYASYVEYGHRTVNHKGWVNGKFMLTISEDEIDAMAPKILESKLKKKLGDLFR